MKHIHTHLRRLLAAALACVATAAMAIDDATLKSYYAGASGKKGTSGVSQPLTACSFLGREPKSNASLGKARDGRAASTRELCQIGALNRARALPNWRRT